MNKNNLNTELDELSEPESEPESESDFDIETDIDNEESDKKKKIKYSHCCSDTTVNVWGKPNLNLLCGDCGESLNAV